MAQLRMPDADVIKSPTHTSPWSEWRYSCCSVFLSCCGGVTTYQSSGSAEWQAGDGGRLCKAAVNQTGRLMEWWGMSKGVGR